MTLPPRFFQAFVRLGSAAMVLLVGVYGMGLTANHWVCNRVAAHWVELMPGAAASGSGVQLGAHAHLVDLDCAVGCCKAWSETQQLTEAAAASQANWTALGWPAGLVPLPAVFGLAPAAGLVHCQQYRPPPEPVWGTRRLALLRQYRI
jgi:hypothetical protein